MVVLMVTLYLRVSMRRSIGFSAKLSLLKSGLAGALVLATIVACYDNGSPTGATNGVIRVRVNAVGTAMSDSAKEAMAAAEFQSESAFMSAPMAPISRNVLASASAALSSAGCGGSGGGEFLGYAKSKVAFGPEQIPVYSPYPYLEDQVIPNMPIGFNFSFYGQIYNTVNIYTNGVLQFGSAPSPTSNGFPNGAVIPSASILNNVLALAWSDWSPHLVQDGIRYETRGSAPNRKYILQFNNVPEFASGQTSTALKANWGSVTVQVVLSEGSNDITIHTKKMSLMNSSHKYTQGIENAGGTEALFDIIQNPTTLVWSNRVAKFFSKISLTDDAVSFTPIVSAATKDLEAPSIVAPSNIIQGNDPGLASAVVAVASPATSDNCSPVALSSARSDGAALNAPYPVGVTTITWTAKDEALNSSSASQTITVEDREAPVFGPMAQSLFSVNATSPSGAVVNYSVNVTDNVKVTSLSCEPASGSVFSAGSHDVSCTASDAAGNSSSMSFSVMVIGAREQIELLIHDVGELPLKNGAANPLINQLRAALNESGNECKKVSDFIDMVSKKVTNASDAAELIRAAEDIMGALGCEVPSSAKVSPVSMRSLDLKIARPAF